MYSRSQKHLILGNSSHSGTMTLLSERGKPEGENDTKTKVEQKGYKTTSAIHRHRIEYKCKIMMDSKNRDVTHDLHDNDNYHDFDGSIIPYDGNNNNSRRNKQLKIGFRLSLLCLVSLVFCFMWICPRSRAASSPYYSLAQPFSRSTISSPRLSAHVPNSGQNVIIRKKKPFVPFPELSQQTSAYIEEQKRQQKEKGEMEKKQKNKNQLSSSSSSSPFRPRSRAGKSLTDIPLLKIERTEKSEIRTVALDNSLLNHYVLEKGPAEDLSQIQLQGNKKKSIKKLSLCGFLLGKVDEETSTIAVHAILENSLISNKATKSKQRKKEKIAVSEVKASKRKYAKKINTTTTDDVHIDIDFDSDTEEKENYENRKVNLIDFVNSKNKELETLCKIFDLQAVGWLYSQDEYLPISPKRKNSKRKRHYDVTNDKSQEVREDSDSLDNQKAKGIILSGQDIFVGGTLHANHMKDSYLKNQIKHGKYFVTVIAKKIFKPIVTNNQETGKKNRKKDATDADTADAGDEGYTDNEVVESDTSRGAQETIHPQYELENTSLEAFQVSNHGIQLCHDKLIAPTSTQGKVHTLVPVLVEGTSTEKVDPVLFTVNVGISSFEQIKEVLQVNIAEAQAQEEQNSRESNGDDSSGSNSRNRSSSSRSSSGGSHNEWKKRMKRREEAKRKIEQGHDILCQKIFATHSSYCKNKTDIINRLKGNNKDGPNDSSNKIIKKKTGLTTTTAVENIKMKISLSDIPVNTLRERLLDFHVLLFFASKLTPPDFRRLCEYLYQPPVDIAALSSSSSSSNSKKGLTRKEKERLKKLKQKEKKKQKLKPLPLALLVTLQAILD